jgi:hypothetical protein
LASCFRPERLKQQISFIQRCLENIFAKKLGF